MDPFALTEEDGWWYGRGSEDNKAGAAILVDGLIRAKREGFVPDRDWVVALTSDEETSSHGIQWLVTEGRDLIGEPEFALNTDAGGGILRAGRETIFLVQASEKIYLTFVLALIFNPPPFIAVGLVILAASPSGITSNAYSFAARADVPLCVTLSAVTSVITVFSIPFLINVALRVFGDEGQLGALPVLPMLIGLISYTLLPLVVGMLVRARRSYLAPVKP